MQDLDQHRDDGTVAIPIAEEILRVDKREIETGRVRVRTQVEVVDEVLRDSVRRGLVDVERVPVGAFVTNTPQVREEGDVLIVPVLEERAVVEKRLFLVEEVRLRRTTETVPVEIPASRRVTRVEIDDQTTNHQQG